MNDIIKNLKKNMKLTEFRKLTNNRDPKFDKALNELGDSLKEFVKRRRLFVCS